MSTPSIQTLITQAQQVLNLKSSNEIRATLAAVLANANVGTPLNPNLTTQQLWDEFYEIVRQPSDDIMSIITDQMMRMVFSPPAPGGASADKQVIFNDGGVLAGDSGLVYNKTTDALTVAGLVTAGSATITGDLTVDTSTLKVDSTNNYVGIGTASPVQSLTISGEASVRVGDAFYWNGYYNAGFKARAAGYAAFIAESGTGDFTIANTTSSAAGAGSSLSFLTRYNIDKDGVATWQNVGGVAGTAMTLNSTGLGIGSAPSYKFQVYGSSPELVVFDSGANGTRLYAKATNTAIFIGGTYSSSPVPINFTLNGGTNTVMTLDASGNLLVGTTSLIGTERLNVTKTTVGSYLARFINTNTTVDTYGITVVYSASTPNDASHNFLGCTDSTTSRAFIYANGGLGNFSANNVNLSDARTKTDIKPLTSYWNKIKALELVTFKYKDQTHDDDNIGLISQQVESVAPEFVSNEGFGETPADGVPLKSIYTTDLYHAAIKALQEAMTRIEALESKLA